MGRHKRPKQVPEGQKEAADPVPEVEPDIPEEPKGDSSSRLDASEEPSETDEKRRVREKLQERGQNS